MSTHSSWAAITPLALAVVLCAGCGDRPDGSDGIELTSPDARDKAIAARLAAYIDRNYAYGQQAVLPPEQLSPRERRAFTELSDNAAELNRSIEGISVRDTVVSVQTNLDPDAEGIQTARLICTVIYGADVADFTTGHEVLGLNSRVLAKCSPTTNRLK